MLNNHFFFFFFFCFWSHVLHRVHILRSGHSLLNPPKPIDLDDEEAVAERQLASAPAPGESGPGSRRTLAGGGGRTGNGNGTYEPLFSDEVEEPRVGTGVRNNQGRENLSAEDEEAWDRLG
jgi:hypothetical protein